MIRPLLFLALIVALVPYSASAAPTPVPAPASVPSVRPAVSPAPSPSVAPSPAAPTPAPSRVPASAPEPGRAPAGPAPGRAEHEPTEDADASTEDAEAEPDWHAFVPSDTADHLATMDRAARESGCGVPWQLLAAISRVESDFGRNMATSSAGAVGYGQFLPSSWQAFSQNGNPYDYRDALPAIARYLCQSGLARDPRAALFAYNHADWYVDLVLDLAVRYDRMAPGAPIPQVLDVDPAAALELPLRYAAGRDLTLESARRATREATWLGVPWRGRRAGARIEPSAMETTTFAMVRAAFGVGEPIAREVDADTPIDVLSEQAWSAGLMTWPSTSPSGWSLAELRHRLDSGSPIVLLVRGADLPAHDEARADQPLLVIGSTADGLIVSDPSFSSSLGYGLEVRDVDLLKAWQAASPPLQAVAFARAPRRSQSHVVMVDEPMAIPRIVVTPPPASASAPPEPLALAAPHVDNTASLEVHIAARVGGDDWSWVILCGSAISLLATVVVRRRRGGRSARSGGAAAKPPRSGP
jgi:Transglycosylase SLT domain